MEVTAEQVRRKFYYKDGNLYRNGKKAGTVSIGKYVHIYFKGKIHPGHRLIYLYCHGELPPMIDHIDGNGLNNKIENLRPCDKKTNGWNMAVTKRSKTGVKNVSWSNTGKCWRVQVSANREKVVDFSTKDFELAEFVSKEAREHFHNEFACHR